MKFQKKTRVLALFVIVFLISMPLFQNFTPAPENPDFSTLRPAYMKNLSLALNTWEGIDILAYSTGHICQPTSVSLGINQSYIGKPYLTPKIQRLAGLMKNLASIYNYVDDKQKQQIITISTKIYFYLYRQIDWDLNLIKDDYGLCFKGLPKAYSFLSTPEVLLGLHAFYKIIGPENPNYLKLKIIIKNLSVGHLKSADGWITKVGVPVTNGSANFMALNLSVLSILNDIDPNNSYFGLLKHRLITDYAWIRSTWDNYSNEQICGVPLLYGGWSHQTPKAVSEANGVAIDCSYFDQSNSEKLAPIFRSYYLQKVSYHSIITEGLLNLRKLLASRGACSIVNYGTQGTCKELEVILNGSSSWILEMIKEDGSIPTAYKSFDVNEFGYFGDKAGNRPGIRSLMSALAEIHPGKKAEQIGYTLGFPDSNEYRNRVTLNDYRAKIFKTLSYEVNRSGTVLELADSFFLAEEYFR